MSDHSIVLIPEQLGYIPDDYSQESVLPALHATFATADSIRLLRLRNFEFFDCGANFEKIACPACNKPVKLAIWQDWMDEDYSNDTWTLRSRRLNCCQQKANLHQLKYRFAQGFALFAVEIENPRIASIPAKAILELERELGCELRLIRRHI